MTNFENNKTELVRLLVTMPDTCIRVWQMRTGNSSFSCPSAMAAELDGGEICKDCEKQNEAWLLGFEG